MRDGRPASFYWLALFFGLFVLFLYGPMIAIFVLSFQGPEGGLTIVQLIAATTTAGGLKLRLNPIRTHIRQGSRYPMPKWKASTSFAMIFTANGTTPSTRDHQRRSDNCRTCPKDYFAGGQVYPLDDFPGRSRDALRIASDRVKAKYGFACSRAGLSLADIERSAAPFASMPAADVAIEAFED